MTPKNDDTTKDGSKIVEFPKIDKEFIGVVRLKANKERNVQEQTFRFQKERIVVGSVVSADIRLTGKEIAPIHAVIEINPSDSSATVFDLASPTGIKVNGKKAVVSKIKPQDDLEIGIYRLDISVEGLDKHYSAKRRSRVRLSGHKKLFLDPEEDFSPLILEDERNVGEIFDYRPTSSSALEVVMSWCGTILDVEHFVHEREVVLGSDPGSHFGIPPVLKSRRHPIVTRTSSGYQLNIDPAMDGVIYQDGELKDIDTVKKQRNPGRHGHELALNKNDFAKVTLNDIDFYLSFTSAPPRLKPQKIFDRDPIFWQVLLGSFAFGVALFLALFNMPVDQKIEAEELPERVVTILYQPEKFSAYQLMHRSQPTETQQESKIKPPPIPKEPRPKQTVQLDIKPKGEQVANKPIPKEMDVSKAAQQQEAKNKAVAKVAQAKTQAPKGSAGDEGAGARARGEEGTRGSKTSDRAGPPQNKAFRPSPEGGAGSGGGQSQVPGQGNIALLKGASDKIKDLLGASADKLGKSGSRLQGFGGFTTHGGGGQALTGSGPGGGGTAADLGGLSDHGQGGGRVGTGMGAAGAGGSLAGSQARVVLRTGGDEETVVMGSIDADAVEAALLAHKDEFRLCYERELNKGNEKLGGRVATVFMIGDRGLVTEAGISSTSLNNVEAERCILKVIRRIQFPIPRGAGVVQVRYPFKFRPVNG